MLTRLERSEQRRRPSDDDLMQRALGLSDRYLGRPGDAGVGALGREPEVAVGLLHAR